MQPQPLNSLPLIAVIVLTVLLLWPGLVERCGRVIVLALVVFSFVMFLPF